MKEKIQEQQKISSNVREYLRYSSHVLELQSRGKKKVKTDVCAMRGHLKVLLEKASPNEQELLKKAFDVETFDWGSLIDTSVKGQVSICQCVFDD